MNILIIRFSSLGDLVTLEPMFRAIRFFFKKSNITFVTTSIGKDLYDTTDYFNEYILSKDYYKTIKKVREKKYDVVFNLQCNTKSHIISLFCHKKLLINSASNIWQKIFGQKVKVRPIEITLSKVISDQKQLEYYFKCKSSKIIQLPSDQDQTKAYIVISTGSSKPWPSKRWGIENYINLIKLLKKDGHDIILVGSDLEKNDEKKIKQNIDNITSFIGKTSLKELKNILSCAKIYIGNDSGPSHVAAALGTNTVTIFGSTSEIHCVKFAPYRGKHFCIKPSKNIKCHPCYKRICDKNMECMKDIKPNMVYKIVKEAINDKN